ncbi:MAG: choice-of-anchor D domain-containing protein, partial [Bacteroidales bacterium]|nr:choice-of-anchor D domain-containing protein [Bacteroidales bacterium]
MKHLLLKKSFLLLASILILSSLNIYAQNIYLSFREGMKEKAERIETMPIRTYQSLKSNNVEIGYNFTGAYVAETVVEKTTYNFLQIKGFAKMSQVGAPALPVHNEIIAMPRDATGKIIILETNYYEYDGFMVHPALEPARDTEGAPSPEFQKDDAIYTKDEFFPKNIVEIVNVGLSRGTGLATTQIRPVQFNPVTGKIRVYTSIKYRLETIGGEKTFDYISKENTLHYSNLLKRNVINSDMIPDGVSQTVFNDNKTGAKNYIIITHSEYLSQANDLADWKRQLGYSVEVVSQSSWTAAQVNTEVHNRYDTWTPKPDYFVIIGDHTGSYAVPGEIHQAPSTDDFATDLYVACMDGGSDYVPDMAHGRISVSSSAEATIVVNKIINYEKIPTTNTNFYNNILNCSQYQDTDDNDGYADRRFCHTSEEIRDYLQGNYAYTSTRVYYTSTTWDITDLHYNNGYYSNGQLLPAELRNLSFNWNGGSSDITSAIDAGKFMVFHRDHGYVGGSGWAHPYYTTTSMTSLANGDKLPVIFSMNCHTGEFQLDNCFVEKFLRMENKGAVGMIGAAYYSYSGYNDALSEGMIDAIWSNPGLHPDFGTAGNGGSYTIGAGNDIYTMGDVVNQGLYAMVQNFGDNTYTHELFHYFGDPAMKIWTANPNDNTITATHDATIDCANNSFSITGSNANALATLVHNNELIAQTTLDGSGDGTINYSLSVAGDVTLTISKHNCKPYVTVLTQTCTGYPAVVVTNSATSVTTNTATLNGEITNDNGETVTESGFVYSTSPEPFIGGEGVTQILTSPTVTTGTFNEDISGLSANTTYYFKAYAINANGTGYGANIEFKTDHGYPYVESFEDGLGKWLQAGDDDIDWTRQTGGTPSSNTGPDGAYDGSYYLFTEASGFNNMTASLEADFNFTNISSPGLYFYYHMYGSAMGALSVDIYDGSIWYNDFYQISGQQQTSNSDIFQQAYVDISDFGSLNNITIRLRGVTGSSFESDICIDNIEIFQTQPLTYQSSTLIQNTDDVYQGVTEQEIIGIQIEISGRADTLSITQFNFNTTGTTNTADILNAKLFYTDTTNTFTTNNQFGTTVSNPNGTFSITDSLDLLSGTNYFWLTYDVASSATPSNLLDAQCTDIIVGGNTETPVNPNPTGEVTIVEAPVLSVSIDSLNATVTQCNDSVTQQFTIENTGGGELIFNISDDSLYITINTVDWSSEVSWDIRNNADDILISGSGYSDNSTYQYSILLLSGQYVFNSYDSFGDGWNGGTYELTKNDEIIANNNGNSPAGSGETEPFEILSWINLSTYTDTINSGASQQIDVEFNAKNLNEKIYNAEIIINSNDLINTADTIICTFTVQGSPAIALSDTAFHFGDVYINSTSTDTLLISNTGCDTLFITNITSSVGEFTVDTTLLNIMPDSSAEVFVTFAPTTLGNFNGILTVYNNDTDSTINLSGTGIAAPVLLVSTDSLNAMVTQCYDSVTQQFTIENTGGGELSFNIIGGANSSFDSTSTIYYTSSGETTEHIFKELNTYADSIYIIVTLNGDYDNGTEYASLSIDGTFIEQIDDGNVSNGTDIVKSYAFGGTYVNNWLSDGQITVSVINCAEVGPGNGGLDLNTVQLMINGAEWINLSVFSDTIPAGDSIIIDVEFNAKNLNTGVYNAEMIVNSNDPVNTADTIACTFIVQGSPAIALSDTAFHFGDVYINSISTDTLLISNTGCDTLFITNITSSISEFTVDTTFLNIIPGDSAEIFITFAPTTPGSFNSVLTVYNNDADTTINLSGTGIAAPVLSVSTDSLNATITQCNDSVTQQFTIENTGGGELIFNIPSDSLYITINTVDYGSEVSWDIRNSADNILISGSGYSNNSTYQYSILLLSGQYVFNSYDSFGDGWNGGTYELTKNDEIIANNNGNSPAGFGETEPFEILSWINLSTYTDTINSGASQQIDVEFNAINLNTGVYNAEIIVNSNDPVNTADTIICTFTVQGSPAIALSDTAFHFGDVYINSTSTDTLLISNTGCDTLFITNITSSIAEFTVDTTFLNIIPGDSTEVFITFAPTTLGSFNSVLTVYNNDVDTTINLNGTGIAAPVLSVSTDSLNATVTQCNDSVTQQFTIE